jgi:hypothetical protein
MSVWCCQNATKATSILVAPLPGLEGGFCRRGL